MDLPEITVSQSQFEQLSDTILDSQIPHTPRVVQFCRRCVVSNQRPRIFFDDEGVCSACRYWDRKSTLDWEARQDRLSDILARYRSSRGDYDVVVPGSGGKDSAYVAHQLRDHWGMNPLTVTWSPHSCTEIGRENFDAFVHAGFDNISGTPNGMLHRKLSLLSTVTVGDNFLPFTWGQISFPFHIAEKFGIPLVFFGENGEAEYGGSADVEDAPGMPLDAWVANYWKGVTVQRLLELGSDIGLFSTIESDSASRLYSPPDLVNANINIEHYWYGYFYDWRPQENYYYAVKHTGFQAKPDGRSEATYSKYASLDDRLDGFHYYFGLLKFGLGRATSDAAHEVREGLITREEAIALVHRYELEFPSAHFEYFLRYIGLDKERFHQVCDRFRSQHLWRKTPQGEWELKFPIWDALIHAG